VALAGELAQGELPVPSHLGVPRVADVGVVRPDHDLRRPPRSVEVLEKRVERLGHVTVAQVPRVGPGAEHRPVVALGTGHQAGVLEREEVRVLGQARVVRVGRRPALLELDQLLQDGALAALLAAADDGGTVGLAVLPTPVVEAAVALAGPLRGLRVDLVEVAQDEIHRLVQAVQVQPVDADRVGGALVVRAQPDGERLDDPVAPHPAWEAAEVAERLRRGAVLARPADEAVQPVGGGPVGLDRDGVEARRLDQPAGDAGALDVELVRPVRRLADQHAAGGADAIDQRVVVVRRAGDRQRGRQRRVGPDGAHPGRS
jgi:hypothetical protein